MITRFAVRSLGRMSSTGMRRGVHTVPPNALGRGRWMAGAGGVAAALASYAAVTIGSERVRQESVKEIVKMDPRPIPIVEEPHSASIAAVELESPSPSAEKEEEISGTPEEVSTKAEEAEDEGSAAFDPVTGEINWDCPCLGGMAHGPCGEEFRAAFSCFVYSEQEPKGIDCVEKFKGMQDCFRLHPEIYGEEADDDEAADPSALGGESTPEVEDEEPEPPKRKWRSRYEED